MIPGVVHVFHTCRVFLFDGDIVEWTVDKIDRAHTLEDAGSAQVTDKERAWIVFRRNWLLLPSGSGKW
jgi:hypothetical protein